MIFNVELFCYYQPNEKRNLTDMVLDPKVKIVRSNDNWNITKGNYVKIPQNVEWLNNKTFLTPYGIVTIQENFIEVFKEKDFNFKKFFKDKNMYMIWIKKEDKDQGITHLKYYPRITWSNRKGFKRTK